MGSSRSKKDVGMRLDAYLARAGLASRREARGLIRRGVVAVDGVVCQDAARQVREEHVQLEGQSVDSPACLRDFILNKPVGFACSDDERETPRVRDLLPEDLRRRALRIAGRLDRATSGLLVLTVDGEWVHRVTHPSRKLSKRYCIAYEGELAADAAERCAKGFLLRGENRPTRPADLVLLDPGHATLVLREGRTHQVRRMIRALGAEVVSLHRDRIGALKLPDDLAEGALRPLAPEDRALLLSDRSL